MNKTYVIGDIHGCYDEFMELIQKIGITDDDFIISLGDIVDRGNKSVELYRFFKNRKNSMVLMGNHERKHLKGVLSYAQEIVKVQFQEEYTDFIKWIETLPYYHETESAIIVHAFFEHDVKLQDQKEEVLSGTTAGIRYLDKKYEEGKYWNDSYLGHKSIIYGHHVVGDSPKILNNTYGIDTGACHGGMLTALELPDFKIHQVRVKTDHWKEEQAKWQIPVLKAKNWEHMKLSQVQKQIEKLGYKEEPEVIEFLKHLKNWLLEIQNLVTQIKVKLEELTEQLKEKYAINFNQEVSKLEYRVYLFKAKSNNLTLEDLNKNLDTPYKINDLAKQLGIENTPTLHAIN